MAGFSFSAAAGRAEQRQSLLTALIFPDAEEEGKGIEWPEGQGKGGLTKVDSGKLTRYTETEKPMNNRLKQEILKMPVLSMFYGIIIRMYSEESSKHSKPHFHAYYAENEAVFDLEGDVIEGNLPKNKLSLVRAWTDIHKDELAANWELLKRGDPFFKINPLT